MANNYGIPETVLVVADNPQGKAMINKCDLKDHKLWVEKNETQKDDKKQDEKHASSKKESNKKEKVSK